MEVFKRDVEDILVPAAGLILELKLHQKGVVGLSVGSDKIERFFGNPVMAVRLLVLVDVRPDPGP